MRCSRICTARSACSPKAWCRRSCHSAIRISSGRATASRRSSGTRLAHLRRRSGARARWPLVGARRSHAGAVGRGLCARESRDRRAGAAAIRFANWACAACADSSASCVSACSPSSTTDEKPLAVILTPGPLNETYFEHAYLARQLGLPLVEGNDLTVRGDTVYLKTLAGLRRVHAILRRLDDDFCDPVELRSDSALGVPGLLGAVRAGRVVLANALGTGVLESAAWLGFLPGVAERLLGEIADAAGGGDVVVRRAAGARLRARESRSPRHQADVSEPAFRAGVRARSRERGARGLHRAAARAAVCIRRAGTLALSQAPVWRPNGAPGFRSEGARRFACTRSRRTNGFRVMPGGLARVATDAAVDVVSTQRGGGSKDIWVLSERDTVENRELPARARAQPALRHDDIPSRARREPVLARALHVRCADKARLMRSTARGAHRRERLGACRADLRDARRDPRRRRIPP